MKKKSIKKGSEYVKKGRSVIPRKDRQADALSYDWASLARKSQHVPAGNWTVWLLMAGRGFGKTRTGAETIRLWVREKIYKRIALVADTLEEARGIMVEGSSGIMRISPPSEKPKFVWCKGELTWENGVQAFLYSAENYEKLRGPEFDSAWVDELAKFRNVQAVWDQLMFGLRLGKRPRVIVTTTPRPLLFLEKLIASPHTHLTKGCSYENKKNLSPIFLNQILKTYEGTSLGEQEIYAHLLTESTGALWGRELIRYVREI